MLVYLGLISNENMQIEGFWYYLFTGVFEAATIHYAVAKIFGPLLFGRGWCGYACWTAMVLDFLPYKVPASPRKKLGWLRYIIFAASLIFVAALFLARVGHIERIMFWAFIVGNIVAGLRKRWARDDRPLNIIICENLMDANKVMEGMLKDLLTDEEKKHFDEKVGLVEASIGRMVPVQTEEMKDGDPMRVCVERYGFLPVDKAAFKGEIPEITNMVPFEPFDFYIKRKLYVHNMGHATCAYLGGYEGRKYIYQSIDDPEVLTIVQNAMLESALALSKKYSVELDGLMLHITDLLGRFRNAALKDTCKRVGGDPTRKLGAADRLIGSSLLCLEQGVKPAYIAVGAAGAVYRYLNEAGIEQSKEEAAKVLKEVSGLEADSELAGMILDMYAYFLEGESVSALRRAAQAAKTAGLGKII